MQNYYSGLIRSVSHTVASLMHTCAPEPKSYHIGARNRSFSSVFYDLYFFEALSPSSVSNATYIFQPSPPFFLSSVLLPPLTSSTFSFPNRSEATFTGALLHIRSDEIVDTEKYSDSCVYEASHNKLSEETFPNQYKAASIIPGLKGRLVRCSHQI